MAENTTRWGKVEQPAGREIRLKRRHWAVGDLETRQGIAIVFGDDASHACLVEAAPELLAMVRRYASECAECGDGHSDDFDPAGSGCPECADIRALISKAEGKS